MTEYDDYFKCKYDCTGKVGFSSYQKCTAAIRMLAYGVPGDLVDEYVRMSESTCLEALYRFCRAVVAVFSPEYLREPNVEDTTRLLETMLLGVSRACSVALIACIGSGRTAHLLGRGGTRDMPRTAR